MTGHPANRSKSQTFSSRHKMDGFAMLKNLFKRLFSITSLAAILAVASGCNLYRANKAFDEGKYEEAARAYSRLVQQNPSNVKAKMGYKRSAVLAAEMHLAKAKDLERRGQTDLAQEAIMQALRFDPHNSVALDWLAAIEDAKLLDSDFNSVDEDLRAIREKVEAQSVIRLAPKETSLEDFNITNQPIRDVFKVLGRYFEISFIFHSTFAQGVDTPINISTKNMSLKRILDTLALQNDLYYRYIDSKTVMVFKGGANAAQRAEFENQQYKTIYLDNAKPQDIATTLTRLLGQAQRIQITPDNRLNAIIVKGRPNDVELVTKMTRMLDKAKAEVMVYVELLEVTESSMEQVGLMPVLTPGGEGIYKLGATIDNSGSPNINKGAIRISKSDIRFLFPSLQLDALKTSGEAKMAARQNMRIASDASATFNFGDKIFVVTGSPYGTGSTSQQASQLANQYGYGGLGGYGQNYAQQDVGVKIQITPRVHHNDDITLDLKSEVTSLKASANPDRPDIGQRKLDTEVRMQNGETIIFGGLLREDEVKAKKGPWGLADIPLIGKLVSNNRKDVSKTDVLLTVRCVIVRKPDLRADDFRAFDPDYHLLQEDLEAELKAAKIEAAKAAQKPQAPPAAAEPSRATQPAAGQTGQAGQAQPAAAQTGQTRQAQPAAPAKDSPAHPQPAADLPPLDSAKDGPAESEKASEKKPIESDLILYLSPINSQIPKGAKHQLRLMVSGGKGLSSGELVFKIDPKVKLVGVSGADFLTNEGGNITSDPSADGTTKVSFQRPSSASDSGTLLILDLEGATKGNATITVESYRCYIGDNPITAQIMNALVEVE
jgi:general secretion pathway protein D